MASSRSQFAARLARGEANIRVDVSVAGACVALGLLGVLRLPGFATDPWLRAQDIAAISGEPRRFERPTIETQPRSVLTWNIEQGAGFEEFLTALGGRLRRHPPASGGRLRLSEEPVP